MLTHEVPGSPAKKPRLTSEELTSEEETSEESGQDDDGFYGDLHEMTDQERHIYNEAMRRSDGFDVPLLPNVFALGLIQPTPRNYPTEEVREYAELAIKDQNEKRKKEGGGNHLRLTEVIKCNLQPAGPLNFYITLEAQDIVTGELDEYEAMVGAYCGGKYEVPIFRKKKTKPANHPPASSTDQV